MSDVEPVDRLTAIRARTRTARARAGPGTPSAAPPSRRRGRRVAVAVVTTGDDGGDGGHRARRRRPEHAADQSDDAPVVEPPAATTPVYYVGPAPTAGAEFASTATSSPPADPLELLMGTPSDPDYQTLWERGLAASLRVRRHRIVVTVAPEVTGAELLALQQLVYTLQGGHGHDAAGALREPAIDLGDVPLRRARATSSPTSTSATPASATATAGSLHRSRRRHGSSGTIVCRLVDEDDPEVWSGAAAAA